MCKYWDILEQCRLGSFVISVLTLYLREATMRLNNTINNSTNQCLLHRCKFVFFLQDSLASNICDDKLLYRSLQLYY
ncbi:hypothetical protein Zm00014a_039458 [Zea mays]|uniref:Uncharacterized protein n=1 Tax=Zea mays TaxID=4577 RepID=A0A317YI72_MAIZE|nr:hypothetical protein Zm00014a_039458 [Zea mays]